MVSGLASESEFLYLLRHYLFSVDPLDSRELVIPQSVYLHVSKNTASGL